MHVLCSISKSLYEKQRLPGYGQFNKYTRTDRGGGKDNGDLEGGGGLGHPGIRHVMQDEALPFARGGAWR